MKLAVELYSEKPLFIKEDSFFKLGIRTRGLVMEETVGTDKYKMACMALTGKRLAGTAREIEYNHSIFPAGMGNGEARPGAFIELGEGNLEGLAVILETNAVLDLGLLRANYGLRLVNAAGKGYDIPLSRPDVEVAWNGRGRYVILVGEFVATKLFSA